MPSEFDNRIRFPPTEIDFVNDIGTTGQAHDNYPAPNQQPRFDWMRITLIGLLSQQSSENPPTQKRIGTPWFDRNNNTIKIWDGNNWGSLASFILLSESSNEILSLHDWFLDAQQKLDFVLPRLTFGGHIAKTGVTKIPVPTAISTKIDKIFERLRPLVFVNGSLLDPRRTSFSGCPIFVEVDPSIILEHNDKFTVIIESFNEFVTEEVIAS